MKTSLFVTSLVFCGLTSAAQPAFAQTEKENIVRYRDLGGPTAISALFSENDTNRTFEFLAGDRIPVEIEFQSNIFAIEQEEKSLDFVVQSPFLIKFAPTPAISFDFINFIPLKDAFTGNAGIAIGSANEADPTVSIIRLHGELSRKE